MCFNMFTIFEAFTDLKYHFKGHIKAHLRSFRHICTHIEALFFCRHNNTSVAVSINCSFQHICATLESQVHTMSEPAGTRRAPRGSKNKFTRTRLQQQQVQNGTQLAHTHWQQHQYTHVFSSSKYTTAHTRHTHGTHTLAAASVHTRFQ